MANNVKIEQLQKSLEILKANEKSYNQIRKLRNQLISARNVASLIGILFNGLYRQDVDWVSLCLIRGLHYEDTDGFEALESELKDSIIFVDEAFLGPMLMPIGKPAYLVGDQCADLDVFFPEYFNQIKSSAICPVTYQDNLVGSINMASKSDKRFTADMAMVLMEDLSYTTALCLDNAFVHEQNRKLAVIDPLTGIPNRRYFHEHASRLFSIAKRYNQPLCCLYMDMDGFKDVNDTLGHEAGDSYLKKVSSMLKSRIRKTDVLSRLGGDEFGILLPETNSQKAKLLADSLERGMINLTIKRPWPSGFQPAISVGIAEIEPDDKKVEDLISRADQEMYRRKIARKDQPDR